MAKKLGPINIGISWTGFLIAALISICVAMALIIIKCYYKNTKNATESFQSAGGAAKGGGSVGGSTSVGVNTKIGSVNASVGGSIGGSGHVRAAISLCKASLGVGLGLNAKLRLKIKGKFPQLPCGSTGRKKKPNPSQEEIIINLIATNFMTIYNYNGDPIQSNNDLYRQEFIDLLVSQCYGSEEPDYENIDTELSAKSSITLEEAKALIMKYPCIKANCESMTRRILQADNGTISKVRAGEIPFTVSGTVADKTTGTVSRVPAKLADDFEDTNAKFSEQADGYCETEYDCLMGSAADADPEMNKLFDALVGKYSTNLAMDLLGNYNTFYSDPKNKAIINQPMIPIPESELLADAHTRCTPSEFQSAFGKPQS